MDGTEEEEVVAHACQSCMLLGLTFPECHPQKGGVATWWALQWSSSVDENLSPLSHHQAAGTSLHGKSV